MQEQILIALDNLNKSLDDQNRMLQSMIASTSLEQFHNECGSKQEDCAYNDNSFQEYHHFTSNDLDIIGSNERVNILLDSLPPMDFDHFEPKTESFASPSVSSDFCSIEYPSPPLNTEADCHYCNICVCFGHEARDCPGFAYYADTLSEEDYPYVEHATSEVSNHLDDSIELTNSPVEPLAPVEHIDEDFHRREEESQLCLTPEDTLLECDLNCETSIIQAENLLDSLPVMDLDLCQDNIESCFSPSSASISLSIEPPSYVEPYVNEKNVLSWGDVGSYDFLGIDHLLSHDRVWIGSFLVKNIYPCYVDGAPLLVKIIVLWGWMQDMHKLMVGAQGFCGQNLLIINYKKRKKRRFNEMPLDPVYID